MTRLSIRQLGQGPDIVLLHGWGFDSRIWQPLAEAMGDAFSVTSIDLPGYGSNRGLPPMSFDDTVAAILERIPAGATVVGWSLGGMLALACAAREPARIGRLVLVATTPSFVKRDDWPYGVPPLMLAGFKAAVRADLIGLLQKFAGLINHGDQNARDLTRLFQLIGKTGEPNPEALLLGLDWLRDVDLRSSLPTISTTSLVVHGDLDPLMPIAGARALAEKLPRARLEAFAGVAHAPFFGDPSRFEQSLRAFAQCTVAGC